MLPNGHAYLDLACSQELATKVWHGGNKINNSKFSQSSICIEFIVLLK